MENKDNPLYPIDLNIFTDHIKSSLSSIIDKVRLIYYKVYNYFIYS